MKTVGILGGSFDPPHIGHAVLAETVITSGEVDEVWIMPARRNPLKSDCLAADNERMDMVNLLVEELTGGIFSSNFELTRGTENGPSYTYFTLRDLHNHYPDHVFKWIVGMDCIDPFACTLRGWRYGDEIVKEHGLIVVSRGGYAEPGSKDIEKFKRKNIIFIESSVIIELSSTYLRSRLLEEDYRGLKTLLTEPVLDYIREKHLYLRP